MRLCVLGPLVAVREDGPVSGRELGSRRGRHLLGMLLVERGGLVPTDRLADLLWPATPPADPIGGVATLASRLRAVLGEEVVGGGRSAYGLVRGGRWTTDLDAASALADEAAARLSADEPGLASAAATRVLAELGGHLGLDDIGDLGESGGTAEDAWLRPLRDEVRLLRRRATHLAVAAGLRTGAPGNLPELAARALAVDPLDEQAARDLMTVLVASGEQAQALRVYAELARALRSELGADPARETRDLHLALLRGEPVGSTAPVSPPVPEARPLLGRTVEVDAVRTAWSDALAGRPSLVVVTGPGGIGKSRLLAEVTGLASGTGGLVLAARCHAAERSLFLQPVADALRPALVALPPPELDGLLGPEDEAWRLLLPELGRAAAGPRAGRAPAGRAGAPACLRDRAAGADPAGPRSPGAARLRRCPGCRVCHPRPARPPHPPSRPRPGAARRGSPRGRGRPVLVRDRRAAPADRPRRPAATPRCTRWPPPPVRMRTPRRSWSAPAGTRFSVVEMLRALAAGRARRPGDGREAVLQRVTRSGEDAATVLRQRACSVRGSTPTSWPACSTCPTSRSCSRCEALVAPALLARTDTGYEFANDLVQEVVYADASPARLRLAYHRRAADLLTRRTGGHGRHAAALGDDARAARGWLLAGQQALDRAATADAVALLTDALAAAEAAGATDLLARVLIWPRSALEALTSFRRRRCRPRPCARRSPSPPVTGAWRCRPSAPGVATCRWPCITRPPVGRLCPSRPGVGRPSWATGGRPPSWDHGSPSSTSAPLRFDEAQGYAEQAVRAAPHLRRRACAGRSDSTASRRCGPTSATGQRWPQSCASCSRCSAAVDHTWVTRGASSSRPSSPCRGGDAETARARSRTPSQ